MTEEQGAALLAAVNTLQETLNTQFTWQNTLLEYYRLALGMQFVALCVVAFFVVVAGVRRER